MIDYRCRLETQHQVDEERLGISPTGGGNFTDNRNVELIGHRVALRASLKSFENIFKPVRKMGRPGTQAMYIHKTSAIPCAKGIKMKNAVESGPEPCCMAIGTDAAALLGNCLVTAGLEHGPRIYLLPSRGASLTLW